MPFKDKQKNMEQKELELINEIINLLGGKGDLIDTEFNLNCFPNSGKKLIWEVGYKMNYPQGKREVSFTNENEDFDLEGLLTFLLNQIKA